MVVLQFQYYPAGKPNSTLSETKIRAEVRLFDTVGSKHFSAKVLGNTTCDADKRNAADNKLCQTLTSKRFQDTDEHHGSMAEGLQQSKRWQMTQVVHHEGGTAEKVTGGLQKRKMVTYFYETDKYKK